MPFAPEGSGGTIPTPDSGGGVWDALKGGGTLIGGGVMDALAVPQHIAVGTVKGIEEGDPLRGFSHWNDPNMTPSKQYHLHGLAGFSSDMLFDPLNLVSGAGLLKGVGIAKKAVEAAQTVDKVRLATKGAEAGSALHTVSEGAGAAKKLLLGGHEEDAAGLLDNTYKELANAHPAPRAERLPEATAHLEKAMSLLDPAAGKKSEQALRGIKNLLPRIGAEEGPHALITSINKVNKLIKDTPAAEAWNAGAQILKEDAAFNGLDAARAGVNSSIAERHIGEAYGAAKQTDIEAASAAAKQAAERSGNTKILQEIEALDASRTRDDFLTKLTGGVVGRDVVEAAAPVADEAAPVVDEATQAAAKEAELAAERVNKVDEALAAAKEAGDSEKMWQLEQTRNILMNEAERSANAAKAAEKEATKATKSAAESKHLDDPINQYMDVIAKLDDAVAGGKVRERGLSAYDNSVLKARKEKAAAEQAAYDAQKGALKEIKENPVVQARNLEEEAARHLDEAAPKKQQAQDLRDWAYSLRNKTVAQLAEEQTQLQKKAAALRDKVAQDEAAQGAAKDEFTTWQRKQWSNEAHRLEKQFKSRQEDVALPNRDARAIALESGADSIMSEVNQSLAKAQTITEKLNIFKEAGGSSLTLDQQKKFVQLTAQPFFGKLAKADAKLKEIEDAPIDTWLDPAKMETAAMLQRQALTQPNVHMRQAYIRLGIPGVRDPKKLEQVSKAFDLRFENKSLVLRLGKPFRYQNRLTELAAHNPRWVPVLSAAEKTGKIFNPKHGKGTVHAAELMRDAEIRGMENMFMHRIDKAMEKIPKQFAGKGSGLIPGKFNKHDAHIEETFGRVLRDNQDMANRGDHWNNIDVTQEDFTYNKKKFTVDEQTEIDNLHKEFLSLDAGSQEAARELLDFGREAQIINRVFDIDHDIVHNFISQLGKENPDLAKTTSFRASAEGLMFDPGWTRARVELATEGGKKAPSQMQTVEELKKSYQIYFKAQARAIGSRSYVNNLASTVGRRFASEAAAKKLGYVLPKFAEEKKFLKNWFGEDVYLPQEVADAAARVGEAWSSPEEANALLGRLIKINTFFKDMAFNLKPASITTNMIGDLHNLWLEGIDITNVKQTQEFYALRKQVQAWRMGELVDENGKRIADKVVQIEGHDHTLSELAHSMDTQDMQTGLAAEEMGDTSRAVRKNEGTADATRMLQRDPETGKRILKLETNSYRQNAYKIGNSRDAMVRETAYLIAMKQAYKGGVTNKYEAMIEAGTRVHKALYNYMDLTAFEQHALRQAIPFYVWLRKNPPRMLKMVIENPRKMNLEFKTQNESWNAEDAPAPGLTPDYIRNKDVWIPKSISSLPGVSLLTGGKGAAWNLTSPATDINMFQTNRVAGEDATPIAFSDLGGSLTPPVKLLGEAITGQDFYSGIPMSGGKYSLGGLIPQALGDFGGSPGSMVQSWLQTSDRKSYAEIGLGPLLGANIVRDDPQKSMITGIYRMQAIQQNQAHQLEFDNNTGGLKGLFQDTLAKR